MVRRIVSGTGLPDDVDRFEGGRALLARLVEGQRFDVILCDMMMPGMTGMELHGQVLARWPDQAAAIVFMTGGVFTPEAAACLASGPNASVEKPFDLTGLRALVRDGVG